jgi:hypothetical protein
MARDAPASLRRDALADRGARDGTGDECGRDVVIPLDRLAHIFAGAVAFAAIVMVLA